MYFWLFSIKKSSEMCQIYFYIPIVKFVVVRFVHVLWYNILGWYYHILGWKLSKQTSYCSKTGFFSQLKIKTNFHSKITSQNIVRKGHEQVIKTQFKIFLYQPCIDWWIYWIILLSRRYHIKPSIQSGKKPCQIKELSR